MADPREQNNPDEQPVCYNLIDDDLMGSQTFLVIQVVLRQVMKTKRTRHPHPDAGMNWMMITMVSSIIPMTQAAGVETEMSFHRVVPTPSIMTEWRHRLPRTEDARVLQIVEGGAYGRTYVAVETESDRLFVEILGKESLI